MIQNEHQYKVTRKWARKFAQAIEEHDSAGDEAKDIDPRLVKAHRDALQSQLETLNDELREYEALKAGGIPLDQEYIRIYRNPAQSSYPNAHRQGTHSEGLGRAHGTERTADTKIRVIRV